MKLKITGRIYATFNEVIEELFIDLNKDAFSILHTEEITTISINGVMKLFEKDSLIYEVLK